MKIWRIVDAISVDLAILRCAAWFVPGEQRAEWLAEWRSELWYVRQACDRESQSLSHGNKAATAFCMGAFKDALWLRRNSSRSKRRNLFRLESPLWCTFFLVVLTAASLLFTLRLPGAHHAIPFFPDDYPSNVAMISPIRVGMISPIRPYASLFPTIRIEEYRSWTNSAQRLFTSLAFYQSMVSRVDVGQGQKVDFSVAKASKNLFELLNIPVSSLASDPSERDDTAKLILSDAAWRKYFHRDSHIAGRVLYVAGERAMVVGMVSEYSWRLPGKMDAWLLEDDQRLAALPTGSKGVVVAQVRTSAFQPHKDWRMAVPNEKGSYDRFDCVPLAQRIRRPFRYFLFIITLACLILPVTTRLSLGEYPLNRHALPWATRIRRWIFLLTKVVCILLMVYCASFYLEYLRMVGSPLQTLVQFLWVGCLFAFRWALIDQRQRCPVCLRLLTHPVQVGEHARILLGWSGTELMCTKGHGLLHVPEMPTTSFHRQRWLSLDASWGDLFSSVYPVSKSR